MKRETSSPEKGGQALQGGFFAKRAPGKGPENKNKPMRVKITKGEKGNSLS